MESRNMKTRSVFICHLMLVLFAAACVSGTASAEDAYFIKRIHDLTFTDGGLPANIGKRDFSRGYRHRWDAMQSYATLDGDGEAYVLIQGVPTVSSQHGGSIGGPHIVVCAPKNRDVSGRIFVRNDDGTGMHTARFTIPASEGSGQQRKSFLFAKRAYYQHLLGRDIPGAAWFRRQVRGTAEELGQTRIEDQQRRRRFFGRTRANDMENTFALVSGGTAVSENLQLDRVLPAAKPDAIETVAIESLSGITVREFDWTLYVKDIDPTLDILSVVIPDDQHALFFPSFQALVDMVDHVDQQGSPVLRAVEPRAEDATTRDRYQQQLCLPLGQVERLFGQQLINSVALTGSDPYFRTGTDVAVLFEAKNSDALTAVIKTRMTLARSDVPDVDVVRGKVRGVAYEGVKTQNREICCYLAALDNLVVVTNSTKQLARVVGVWRGEEPALASLDEYKYFRHRYPLSDAEETALLVVSDKTIRRWCGARWRIGTSRRTRAAAVMSELQAKHLDQLVNGTSDSRVVNTSHWLPEVDSFTVSSTGVASSVYGNLRFQTPISELDIERVTKEEAQFYTRWRSGYQRNWSNFFDPIAARFFATEQLLSVDLTVMPLIDRSRYEQLVQLSRGASLRNANIDPHGALLHWSLAINTESPLLTQWAGIARSLAPQIRIDPLSWVGDNISIYTDEDPFWTEMAKASDRRQVVMNNFYRAPVALRIGVRSGLKLTAFLAGLRAYLDQTVPGMTVWENETYKDCAYVRIKLSERGRSGRDEWERARLFYAASGEALIITFNENVLRNALDRQIERQGKRHDAADETSDSANPTPLGENMTLAVDRDALRVLSAIFRENYQHMMQARAWGSIPILNEWKRRYPNEDPLILHEKFWNRRLVCPGGGEYRWNEEWQTMESTVYGHPGEPKTGPELPSSLDSVQLAKFGMDFEEHGLRSRVQLIRADAE
jgi:hypothetical protein